MLNSYLTVNVVTGSVWSFLHIYIKTVIVQLQTIRKRLFDDLETMSSFPTKFYFVICFDWENKQTKQQQKQQQQQQ